MARFLRPDIDFSDDDDSIDSERRTTAGPRIISNQIKKTQTNINAIKNPDMYSTEEEDGKVTEEDEPEVVISDDESPRKSPRKPKKRKSENMSSGSTKRKKPKRVENSDDEFLPTDEDSGSNDDEGDNESVASEDLSEDNISDSDFNPDSDEEIDADKDVLFDESQQASEATINLSSDGESPDKKETTKTFDPNSTEFWDKVQELRSKGFSIQQAGNGDTAKSKCSGHMSHSGCMIFFSIFNIHLILSAANCRVLHSVFCATAETASVHRMLSAVAASVAGSLSVWTRCEQRSVCFGQFCVQCVQLCSCAAQNSVSPHSPPLRSVRTVCCVSAAAAAAVFRVRCTASGGQTELCVGGVFLAVCCTEH